MNVFYLDEDPAVCAQFHCDRHVIKMILESAQLLSAAHHVLGTDQTNLYKLTHRYHPSTQWVMQCSGNYEYVYNLFVELLKEWRFRYHNSNNSYSHKCDALIEPLKHLPLHITIGNMTEPPAVMDISIRKNNTIESYRNLYKTVKFNICSWKAPRNKPDWF